MVGPLLATGGVRTRPARSVFGGLSGDYGVEVADGQVRVGAGRLELELAVLVQGRPVDDPLLGDRNRVIPGVFILMPTIR